MFLRSKLLSLSSTTNRQLIRTFLSENFSCQNEWNSRLSAPFMEKIKLDRFYYDIDQSMQETGLIRPVDLDMYVNKCVASPEIHVDEISDLLQRNRSTREATNVLESTGHAVIRNLADSKHFPELLHILENRLTYGVFLDNYLACYLLNHLVKINDFRSAARIACSLMLDEDFSHSLTRSLSLYAAYKYLHDCESFDTSDSSSSDSSDEEKEKKPKGKAKEVKVRVKFLRNEFFDDHFDLKDHKLLIGKTLAIIGNYSEGSIKTNSQILGYTLYGKYDKALKLLKCTKPEEIHKDVLDYCIQFSKDIETEDKSYTDLKSTLEEFSKKSLKTESFEELTKNLVINAVKSEEAKEIDAQKKLYLSWNEIRASKLNEAIEEEKRKERLANIEKLQSEMKAEEQKLWFFENEDQIDLDIEAKKVTYPKRWLGKLKKPRVIDEGYIPPEIIRTRK